MKKATRDVSVGYELPSRTVSMSKFRHGDESSAGAWSKKMWPENIHTDEYANKVGLRGGVAEGPIVFELGLLELLVDFFGESFFTTGVVEVKLTAPVYLGDALTGKAKVREKAAEDSGTRIVLDVWVEKPDGRVAIVGTASALVC